MNTTAAAPAPAMSHGLMRLGEAWRNRSALISLLATLLGFVVLLALGGAIGQPLIVGLFALLALVWMMIGVAAAGQQYAQQAADRPVVSTLEAFTSSPMIVLRMIGIGLLLLVPPIAWALVAAMLLVLCKVPGLGGILLIVVLPVLVFSAALMLLGLYATAGLAFGALCAGHPMRASLSQMWAVATRRPVEAFLHLILLYFVSAIVGFLVMGIIGSGVGMTMGVAAPILGSQISAGFGGMFGGMGGGMGGGGGMMVFGAGLGFGIVMAVGASLLFGILLFGLNLTYLKVIDGLDMSEAQASMSAALEATRRKAQHAAEEAKRHAAQAQEAAQARMAMRREASAAAASGPVSTPAVPPPAAASSSAAAVAATTPMPPPPARPPSPVVDDEATIILSAPRRPSAAATPPAPVPPAPAAPSASRCPACAEPVASDDVFCGSCGHKLR